MSHPEQYTFSQPTGPLCGEVSIPGSKSYTNRALIITSLAGGSSKLFNVSPSNDSTFAHAWTSKTRCISSAGRSRSTYPRPKASLVE